MAQRKGEQTRGLGEELTDVFVVKSALSSTGTPHKMTAGLEKDAGGMMTHIR